MILVCSITVKGKATFVDVILCELSKVYSRWLEGTQPAAKLPNQGANGDKGTERGFQYTKTGNGTTLAQSA